MPDAPAPQQKKSEGWGKLTLFQKIVIGICVIIVLFLIINTWLGGVKSFWEFLFSIITIIGIGIVAYFFIKGILTYLKPSQFSPKDDYFTRTVNVAKSHKPKNVRNLYFTGNETKQAILAGKIIGCIYLPYYVGEPVKNENGELKLVYNKMFDKMVPLYKPVNVDESDGDTLFIYSKSTGLFNEETEYLRCNRKLHTELHGDVFINDFNPVTFGKYFKYPYTQAKTMAAHIMKQSQMEMIIQTYDHQQDLISQSADAGLYANPFFRAKELENAEMQREG